MNTEKIVQIAKDIELVIEKTHTGEVDIMSIIELTTDVMELIEVYPELKGRDKKKALLLIMKNIINHRVTDEDKKQMLLSMVDTVVSSVADVVIDASKGKFNINRAITTVAPGCFAWCMGNAQQAKKPSNTPNPMSDNEQ